MTNENLTAGSIPPPVFYRLANDEGRPISASQPPNSDHFTCSDEELGMSGYPAPCQNGHSPCLIYSDEELSLSTSMIEQCIGCISNGV